jgi:hypothetical protein
VGELLAGLGVAVVLLLALWLAWSELNTPDKKEHKLW